MIHLESCRYSQNRHPQNPRNGYWKESFKTFKEAQDFANGEKPNNSTCSVCNPDANV